MKEYKVITMSAYEFLSILKENSINVDEVEIEYDMDNVCIFDDDGEDISEQIHSILERRFKVDKLSIFCSDTDHKFPDDIMIMLDFNPYE